MNNRGGSDFEFQISWEIGKAGGESRSVGWSATRLSNIEVNRYSVVRIRLSTKVMLAGTMLRGSLCSQYVRS